MDTQEFTRKTPVISIGYGDGSASGKGSWFFTGYGDGYFAGKGDSGGSGYGKGYGLGTGVHDGTGYGCGGACGEADDCSGYGRGSGN